MKDMEQKHRKKHGRRIIFAVLIVIVIAVAAVLIVIGRGRIGRPSNNNIQETAEFVYSAGEDMRFAELEGSLLVVSSADACLLDSGGNELYRRTFVMSDPAVHSAGGSAVVYSCGGRSAVVYSGSGERYTLRCETDIDSAKVNTNGWLAVCTEENGYKGAVCVYDSEGTAVYKWSSGEGFPSTAQVSPDNKLLAVLTYTPSGTRFVFIKLKSEDDFTSCTVPDEIIFDMEFTTNAAVSAISPNALYTADSGGSWAVTADFGGKYLNAYCLGPDVSAVSLKEYRVSSSGTLDTYSSGGSHLGSAELGEIPISVAAGGGSVAVICDSGLYIYDEELSLKTEGPAAAGSLALLVRHDGAVISAGSGNAILYK